MADLLVVTGGSSGLGAALIRTVPFECHTVDVSRSGPERPSTEHLPADLSDPSTWEEVGRRFRDLIDAHQPRRAVFIHAAGTIDPIGFAGEVDSPEYRSAVVLNGGSGQMLGHEFLRAAQGVERTEVVMVTSGAASSVYPGWSAYGPAKAALNQWVRTVGAEQEIRGGATVLSIAPGVMDTNMQRRVRDADAEDFPSIERFERLHSEGDLVAPDVAAARVWSVVESRPSTGEVIDVRDV